MEQTAAQTENVEDNIVGERVDDAVLRNEDRAFWAEVERLGSSRAVSSSTIDGLSDGIAVVALFTSNCRTLFIYLFIYYGFVPEVHRYNMLLYTNKLDDIVQIIAICVPFDMDN
jgi:hypothetical protein